MKIAKIGLRVAAAVLISSVAAEELPRTTGWIEIRTTHFTLYSSAGGRETKKLEVELERFREALGRITKGLEFDSETPIAFHVFRNDARLTPYKPMEDGQSANVSGYFARRPFRNYVALDASASEGMHVVFHEYVHAILDRTFPRLPSWLNEGLAEYYSTFRFHTLSNDAEIGGLIPEHVQTLSRFHLMDIDDLLESDAPLHDEGGRQGLFYAQSWLLVHYLITDEERRARLGRLMGLLRDGAAPEEAVKVALDPDPRALEEELRKYLESGGSRFTIRFDDPIDKEKADRREMAPGEVLYRLGDLLAQLGPERAAAARTHLEAALEQGGPVAAVHAAMGTAAEGAEDFDEADRQYRLATETAGADAEVLARRGRFLLGRFLAGKPPIGGDAEPPASLLEARALLARSVELDPRSVDALAALGETYLFGPGGADEGLIALGRATALRPDRVDVLVDLAGMLAKSGRTAAAWAVVKNQLGSRATDPAEIRLAEASIVQAEWTTVNERVTSGDVEGAIAMLAEIEGKVTDASLREEVVSYRHRLENPKAVVVVSDPATDPAEADRLVDGYNRAIALANVGRPEEALEQLDQLLESCTEETLCDPIRETAERMRSTIEINRTIRGVNEAIEMANTGKRKAAIERLRELERECKEPELAGRIHALLEDLEAR